jgi:hypothetical protein
MQGVGQVLEGCPGGGVCRHAHHPAEHDIAGETSRAGASDACRLRDFQRLVASLLELDGELILAADDQGARRGQLKPMDVVARAPEGSDVS